MLPHRIIAFGSSSVYGRGDPVGGGFIGRLRAWHEPQDQKNLVYNLGVGGDTSEGMLQRFLSECAFRRPDLILLYPGLNDTRRTGSKIAENSVLIEKFRENIEKLIEYSLKLAPTIFISSFPPDESRTTPFQSNWCYLHSDAAEYSKACQEICNSRSVPYFPLFESWSKGVDLLKISVDGLHAGPEGHQKLFEELRDFLIAHCNRL
jgi:lysophospholipase L1-like esterase